MLSNRDRQRSLDNGWRYAALAPDAALDPAALRATAVDWIPAPVPGTAASALRQAGRWSLDQARNFDAEDGWWTCEFEHQAADGVHSALRFDGLATVCEVWLNDELLLSSRNAFHAHEIDVSARLRPLNVLHLRCIALDTALKAKRPRPRWRTRLVSQQQLRWLRTSLLGRIPGWSPPVAATGPWRGVSLIEHDAVQVLATDLRSRLEHGAGVVEACLGLSLRQGLGVHAARLQVGDQQAEAVLLPQAAGELEVRARVHLPAAQRWWPHTHGPAPRYPVRLLLETDAGAFEIDCGSTGFRSLELDTGGERFGLLVNGVPVFCRGACWTTLDIATLDGSDQDLARSLDQFRDAGFNLLRVGGTMVYESDRFYEACAARGIMVWQDACFANLDYPVEDPAFAASVGQEVRQFLTRTQLNPALCLFCGNSEIEQQVAMLGLDPALGRGVLFGELLPGLARELRPDLPYVPSSPTGGVLPFQVDSGLSHYYGVGAYQRPLEDARRAGVRFTSECLAFANVPEPETLELFLRDGEAPPHHPRWKARVPRDAGPGWDFDDVRDHYLQMLYGVDAARLRYADLDRYLYLSRLVSAEVMALTMNEWRRAGSACRGSLVWFWRDLWPGAGWGLVDASGLPKAPYYALRRCCAPVALLLTDEGLNGLALHAVNDGADDLPVRLELALYRQGEVLVARGETLASLPARGGLSWRGDALIGRFTDLTQAYRFGPPGHDVAVASLVHADSGARLGQAFHRPGGLPTIDPELAARAVATTDGGYRVEVSTRRHAHGVWIEARGYEPDDNYFELAPGQQHTVHLRPRQARARLQGYVHCSAGSSPARVVIEDSPAPARSPDPPPA